MADSRQQQLHDQQLEQQSQRHMRELLEVTARAAEAPKPALPATMQQSTQADDLLPDTASSECDGGNLASELAVADDTAGRQPGLQQHGGFVLCHSQWCWPLRDTKHCGKHEITGATGTA